MAVGQLAQPSGGQCVRFLGVTEMRYRIALEAVRPTLHDDELGRSVVDERFDLAPRCVECNVVGSGRHRDIEFGSRCRTFAGFLGSAATRIEKPTVFVQVREYDVGVVFESVKNTVAVMCVDVDVCNSRKSMFVPQVFNRDTAIVENTKPRTGDRMMFVF